MTVQELLIELYESTGEESYLSPYTDINDPSTFDITTAGSVKLLKYLNMGYQKVCTYEAPGNKEISQFPSMKRSVNFQNYVESGTCQAGSTSSTVVFPAASSSVDDYYNDWVIKVTSGTGEGQINYVADYDGATQTGIFIKDFLTTLDSTSVIKIYKNFIKFLPSGHAFSGANVILDPVDTLITIQKLMDLTNEIDIPNGGRSSDYVTSLLTTSDPSEFYFRGDTIYFNSNIEDVLWFKMEYLSYPAELTLATQEPEIPQHFHIAIVLWATWFILAKRLESELAWAAKKNFQDYMRTVMMPGDAMNDRIDGQVELTEGHW